MTAMKTVPFSDLIIK